jgi:Flp pilus assembly secretin CpaC
MIRCSWIAVLAWALTGPSERGVLAEPSKPPEADDGESAHAARSRLDQVEELLEAAKHLEAADAGELARQARAQAARLLLEESARLAQDQKRLESLSVGLEPVPITIQATIVETRQLAQHELIRLIEQSGGTPLNSHSFESPGASIAAILGPSSDGSDLLRALSSADTGLQILSRPLILTLEGNLAEIQIGETRRVIRGVHLADRNTPVPEYTDEDAGIRMSITPTIVSENRIQLDLCVEQSEFLGQEIPIFKDPTSGKTISSPVKDILKAETTTMVPDGGVLLLALDRQMSAGNATSDDSGIRPALLLMLRPKTRDE